MPIGILKLFNFGTNHQTQGCRVMFAQPIDKYNDRQIANQQSIKFQSYNGCFIYLISSVPGSVARYKHVKLKQTIVGIKCLSPVQNFRLSSFKTNCSAIITTFGIGRRDIMCPHRPYYELFRTYRLSLYPMSKR